MSIWKIQLHFDWVGIEPHGTYPCKSNINCYKHVQEFFIKVTAILEPGRSTQTDISTTTLHLLIILTFPCISLYSSEVRALRHVQGRGLGDGEGESIQLVGEEEDER